MHSNSVYLFVKLVCHIETSENIMNLSWSTGSYIMLIFHTKGLSKTLEVRSGMKNLKFSTLHLLENGMNLCSCL